MISETSFVPEPATVSWEEVVRTHAATVYAYALWLTGNRPDAEDLVQDVFMRAFRASAAVTPRNYGAWLRRITQNLFFDQLRRQQIVRFVALPEQLERDLPDPHPNPADALDRRSFDADVERALEFLSANSRAAVILRDIDGLSYDEIATFMGVQRGTVRSRIHRGRRQLRTALAHRGPGRSTVTSPR